MNGYMYISLSVCYCFQTFTKFVNIIILKSFIHNLNIDIWKCIIKSRIFVLIRN